MQATNLLKSADKCDMIQADYQQRFVVDRSELEEEHRNLLQRIHQLRRLLGYPPIMTGKKRRDQE